MSDYRQPTLWTTRTKTIGKPQDRLSIEMQFHPPDDALRSGINRALNRIGIKWQAGAKQATPVDTGRLRSSIAFVTPTVRALHTTAYEGHVETYMPPEARPNSVHVGTNVDYARAVHEGVPAHTEWVKRHWVRPHKRKTKHGVVMVQGHYRGEHKRRAPERRASKFIENPGKQLLPEFIRIFREELGDF